MEKKNIYPIKYIITGTSQNWDGTLLPMQRDMYDGFIESQYPPYIVLKAYVVKREETIMPDGSIDEKYYVVLPQNNDNMNIRMYPKIDTFNYCDTFNPMGGAVYDSFEEAKEIASLINDSSKLDERKKKRAEELEQKLLDLTEDLEVTKENQERKKLILD